jgi:hypothetical protein
MTDRITQSVVTLRSAVDLGPSARTLPAGAYRCTVEEELIEGLSFAAFHRVATTFEIPAIGTASAARQYVAVDTALLDAALNAGIAEQDLRDT